MWFCFWRSALTWCLSAVSKATNLFCIKRYDRNYHMPFYLTSILKHLYYKVYRKGRNTCSVFLSTFLNKTNKCQANDKTFNPVMVPTITNLILKRTLACAVGHVHSRTVSTLNPFALTPMAALSSTGLKEKICTKES